MSGEVAKHTAVPARSEARTLAHVPALDGLRGLALAGVLLFHADEVLVGGYLGVDLFFVLSGYLITALLLAERAATGRIDLRAFWVRRARRLFPALLALMPAVAAIAYFVSKPEDGASVRADALATLGYVANWRAIFSHKSYWELFASPSPLEHTWSLSIEEQFYVAWPLVVWALSRRGRRTLFAVTLILLLASMIAMFVLFDPASTTRAYYGTDTRAAAILAGAALAQALPRGPRVGVLDVFGALALVSLGVAWYGLGGSSSFLYRGGFWLTELCALVLVACAVRGGAVARALSIAPLRLLGAVSYGAYLWHWPINVVLTAERARVHGLPLEALRLAVTLAVSAVSYVALERPIRRRGVARPLIVVPASVAAAIACVLAGTSRPPPPPPPPPPLPPPAERVRYRVVMLGDSTANSLGWALRGVSPPGVGVDLQGKDGFNLIVDDPDASSWATLAPRDATIVVLSGAFLYGLTVRGEWRTACHPAWDLAFESALARRLEQLREPASQVWIVTNPYALGPYDNARFRRQIDCVNASIAKVQRTYAFVRVLDLASLLCPAGDCQREYAGKTIRPDGVHYDIDGAHDLATRAMAEIAPPMGDP